MAQIGAGLGTGYPGTIDTAQTFQTGTPLAPDSDTRLDAEVVNDITAAIIAIQTILGALPQGAFGSVVARLVNIESRLSALEGP